MTKGRLALEILLRKFDFVARVVERPEAFYVHVKDEEVLVSDVVLDNGRTFRGKRVFWVLKRPDTAATVYVPRRC